MEENLLDLVKSSWRKDAMVMAGGMPPTNADAEAHEIERAFMDQAYNYIQGKAGPLLLPDYRLGFEVVYKNDQNTRMVGIFAFRVENELLFIPVFFVSSNIKGTDLLYRAKTKLFVPLTEGWCDEIIGNIKFRQGDYVDDKEIARQDGLNLDKIIEPPQTRKFAKQAYAEMLEKLLFEDENEQSVKLASFLKEAGANGLSFVQELIDRDSDFAEAMFINYEDNDWIPSSVESKPRDSLVSFKLAAEKCAGSELETFFKQGFVVEDKRASANDTIKARQNFEVGISAGPNEILDQNLNASKVIVASRMYDLGKKKDTNEHLPAYVPKPGSNYDIPVSMDGTCSLIYDLNTQQLHELSVPLSEIVVANDVAPITMESVQKLAVKPSSIKPKTPYVIVSKDGKQLDYFFVLGKNRKKNGVLTFLTTPHPEDIKADTANSEIYTTQLVISEIEDAMSSPKNNVYAAKDIYVLPLKLQENGRVFSEPLTLFTQDNLSEFLKNGSENETPSQLICRENNEFCLKTAGKTISGLNEFTALVGLIKECNLTEAAAREAIEMSKESHVFDFIHDKVATSLRFPEAMDVDGVEYDSIYNVLSEETPQIDIIESEGDYPEIKTVEEMLEEQQRLTSAAPLGNMHPIEIAQVSERTGIKSIFDHGVIASLSKTFDSKGLIDNYLPDLEIALDKLGRLLFLFYWKPEDFLELYGTDDQSSLENSLVSNFKAFGELVLELKNKNQQHTAGSAPLSA